MTRDNDGEDSVLNVTRRSTLLGMGGLAIGTGVHNENSERTGSEPPQSDSSRNRGRVGFRASVDEGLPGDKFGKIRIGQYAHSLQVSGTRRPAWMVQPFNEDAQTSSTTYEETDSNIGYGMIPFPPGQVPLLRVVGHFDNHAESTTSLRISIANRPIYRPSQQAEPQPLDEDDIKQTILEVTGKGRTQVYSEAYLSDFEDVTTGMPNGSELPINTFILEMKTDCSKENSSIKSETTVSLELEAL